MYMIVHDLRERMSPNLLLDLLCFKPNRENHHIII